MVYLGAAWHCGMINSFQTVDPGLRSLSNKSIYFMMGQTVQNYWTSKRSPSSALWEFKDALHPESKKIKADILKFKLCKDWS